MSLVIIDNKDRKAYENLSKTQAAQIVGVSRVTVWRWSAAARKVYGRFEIYFRPERRKQKPGTPKNPPVKKKTEPPQPSFRRM